MENDKEEDAISFGEDDAEENLSVEKQIEDEPIEEESVDATEEPLYEQEEVKEEAKKETKERSEANRERMSEIKKEILTLEWDEKRNQINAAKKMRLDELRNEFKKLEENA